MSNRQRPTGARPAGPRDEDLATAVWPADGHVHTCSLPARHVGWHADRVSGVEWSRTPTIRSLVGTLVDRLLGARCVRCTQRVFPRDAAAHLRVCGGRPAMPPRGATS